MRLLVGLLPASVVAMFMKAWPTFAKFVEDCPSCPFCP
jgi:hypothetical protein